MFLFPSWKSPPFRLQKGWIKQLNQPLQFLQSFDFDSIYNWFLYWTRHVNSSQTVKVKLTKISRLPPKPPARFLLKLQDVTAAVSHGSYGRISLCVILKGWMENNLIGNVLNPKWNMDLDTERLKQNDMELNLKKVCRPSFPFATHHLQIPSCRLLSRSWDLFSVEFNVKSEKLKPKSTL